MYPQIFEIRIEDDNPTKKFYAGQIIEGRVILVLGKEKLIRGIVIRLIGKGNVFWDTTIKHNTVYRETEVYCNVICQLLAPEDGRQTILPPGSFEYLFSIQIPPNVPSSIEGQHCFIRYSLQASLQRPWKDDQIQEQVIHVISVSDLSSSSPETLLPASMTKEKYVGLPLICGTAGPIILNFMIGKTGFVPGEFLQYGVEIRNTSSTKINRVHVSLKRQLKGHAKGETKSSHDKILQLNGPSSEIGGYLLWQSNFEIPSHLIASELQGCTIISIQYYVEIKLVLEKWADVKFTMPIIIGSAAVQQRTLSSSETFNYHHTHHQQQHETPTKKANKSRQNSVVMSRKNSVIKSPITGEEFQYNEDEDEDLNSIPCWGNNEEEVEKVTMNMGQTPFNNEIMLDNGFAFSTLPPLDLTFFQTKTERNPYFKCYEDCEPSYPYRFMSTNNVSSQVTRPPRPHSNPQTRHWGKSVYWGDDNEDE